MSVAGFNHAFISMDGQLRLLTFSSIHFYYVEMLTIWILHSAAWQSSSPKDGIGTQGLPTTPVVKRVIRLDVPVDKFPNVCMSIPLQNCLFSTLISCNNSFYTPSNLSSIILLAEFSDLVGTPWKESKPWLNAGFTLEAVALSRILLRSTASSPTLVLARFIPVLLKGDMLGLMLGLSSLKVPLSIANSLNCCFL